MKLIDKSTLVAEIEKRKNKNQQICTAEGSGAFYEDGFILDIINSLDTLEVTEVDLELVTDWFDHIAQIADDRMTLTNQRMTDAHALDEIKCLAKNSSAFIAKHYKAQKGE